MILLLYVSGCPLLDTLRLIRSALSQISPYLLSSVSPQRLAYSPDVPVGDAAKLYWHFRRAGQSGFAGVIITLFLYAVLFLLSATVLFIYLLR